MRNKIARSLATILCSFFVPLALAASFVATVEETNITFGQSIQLKLELEDAKARTSLDLSQLAKDFNIYSQQQFTSYSSINGTVKSEYGWNVTLMPKRVGEFVIPPIALETDKGVLTTDDIKISVQQTAKSGDKGPRDSIGISLVSTVNKTKSYINEPVIYTLKIISYKPIANVVLDDIKSNDAIIEKIGEPKQYDQTHGGMRAHIIEIRYAVTALKPGVVTIAPAMMHGELQVPTQTQRTQRFGLFNNVFMDNMFELKPFSLQSEPITIEIKPAVGSTQNWLPLQNLTMSQTWDTAKEIKVGDTITRKIKIVGKGSFAKQLPSVKDFMPENDVKTYANKPTFTDGFDANSESLVGTREEEYSIVPQTAGSITFPEVQIKWWNLRTKKIEITTLPAKTLQVMPNTSAAATGVTLDYSDEEQPQQVTAPIPVDTQKKPILLYAIIGILIGIIISLGIVLAFVMFRKRNPKPTKVKVRKKEDEIEINTIDDLRKFILYYAIKNWRVPKDITLNRLGDALTSNNYSYNLEIYTSLSQYINAGIYAKVLVDMELLMAQWEEFKKSVIKIKNTTSTKVDEDYSKLNPT